MKLQKRLAALLMAACVILGTTVTAHAHEAVDMSRTGSITVTMRYNKNPVRDGKLTIYQVAKVQEDDGNYSLVLTDAFAKSGVSLDIDNMDASALAKTAKDLSSYVTKEKLSGEILTINNEGTVTARDLALGLYLVVQTKAAEGYNAVSPFLVSVPMNEDGHYIYAVDATPKLEQITKRRSTTPPQTPGTSKTPGVTGSRLPQTGQLSWPVPVLSGLGLLLVALGWSLRRKEQHCRV